MSAKEFARWQLLYEQEPFDDEYTFRLPGAMVCSIVANVNRDPKARKEPYSPSDFLPFAGRALLEDEAQPEETQTDDDIRERLNAIASTMNGTPLK